jgi:hypothetical protein
MQMAELFGRDVTVIGRHLANAQSEELDGIPTSAKYALVQKEGGRETERLVDHYNLDAIISVGYRVKSREGVMFRRWASDVLKRYALTGEARNESRMHAVDQIAKVMARSDDAAVAGVAELIQQYASG